jgi:hypothetical protein
VEKITCAMRRRSPTFATLPMVVSVPLGANGLWRRIS